MPGRAAALFHQMNVLDAHSPFDRLNHVVDRQAGNRHGCERFHLHSGWTSYFHHPAHDQAGEGSIRLDVDRHFGKGERMTQGDQIMRSLRGHYSGYAGCAENVAFFRIPSEYEIERARAHNDTTLGGRGPLRRGFGRNVYHARFAAFTEVRELVCHLLFGGRRMFARQQRPRSRGDVGRPHQALADQES